MASAQVTSWNQSGAILMPGSAGGAAAAAFRSRARCAWVGRWACFAWACLAWAWLPAGGPGRGGLRLRPPAAGPLVLLGPRACGLPGRGHQI